VRRAVDYAHLLGKVIRMERDNLEDDDTQTDGMEAILVAVYDITTADGQRGVVFQGDYGMGWTVWDHQADDWHFAITLHEPTMRDFSWHGRVVPQTFGMAQRLKREAEARNERH
jgi:hypothetical protein